ncbi:MAG: MbcA/ParS/Xre antitoxin family protein [Acidobacteriota bacterium]|nr:MbcA/ParS/Xre antitoxin family protein [Acidobacteriota bacterium]MDQ7087585.1 MbcA/ParS/Xre antitoxin family protein [Acidobacteriota bacterium]
MDADPAGAPGEGFAGRRASPPEAAGVLTRALLRAAEELALPGRSLARVIGISEASVSRLARGRRIDPGSKEGELALLFLRLFRSLDTLVGGDASAARAWLHADNHHLGGVPAERIESVTGLVDVVEYLDAMRGRA